VHAVAGANRALGVGHPDVHVQTAVRRHAQQPACVVADRRVPQPAAVHHLAERRSGMEPGPEQADAGRANALTQSGQDGHRVRGTGDDLRGELDHPVRELAFQVPRAGGRGRKDTLGDRRERERLAVGQEQLLLHPQPKRHLGAKAMAPGDRAGLDGEALHASSWPWGCD
jgi:hypothetical protein